jgi:hypothetical protein
MFDVNHPSLQSCRLHCSRTKGQGEGEESLLEILRYRAWYICARIYLKIQCSSPSFPVSNSRSWIVNGGQNTS